MLKLKNPKVFLIRKIGKSNDQLQNQHLTPNPTLNLKKNKIQP